VGGYIKMVLKEVRCDVLDWIRVGKDRIWWQALVSKEMRLQIMHPAWNTLKV
jgi:hypothetical protein